MKRMMDLQMNSIETRILIFQILAVSALFFTVLGCRSTDGDEFGSENLNSAPKNTRQPVSPRNCPATRRFPGITAAKGETASVRKQPTQKLNLQKICSSERPAALKELDSAEAKTIASTLAILDKAGDALPGEFSCPWLTMEFLDLSHPSKWKKTNQTASSGVATQGYQSSNEPGANNLTESSANSQMSHYPPYDVIDARLISLLGRLKVLVVDGLDIVYPGELEKLKNIRHLSFHNLNLNSEDYFWIEKLIDSKTLARVDFISSRDDDRVLADLKNSFDEIGIQLQFTPSSENKYNTCLFRPNNDPATCPHLKIHSSTIPLRVAPSDRNTGKPLALLNPGDYLTRIENVGIFTKVKTISKNPKIGFIRQEESKCIAKFINTNQSNASE